LSVYKSVHMIDYQYFVLKDNTGNIETLKVLSIGFHGQLLFFIRNWPDHSKAKIEIQSIKQKEHIKTNPYCV